MVNKASCVNRRVQRALTAWRQYNGFVVGNVNKNTNKKTIKI